MCRPTNNKDSTLVLYTYLANRPQSFCSPNFTFAFLLLACELTYNSIVTASLYWCLLLVLFHISFDRPRWTGKRAFLVNNGHRTGNLVCIIPSHMR